MSEIEPQEIQRLLDGTLLDEERRLLLQQAESHPENWRVIALAFVEEQLLRSHLAAILPSDRVVKKSATERVNERPHGTTRWLSQVVALAVTLGIGLAAGRALWAGDYTIVVAPTPSATLAGPPRSQNATAFDQMLAPVFDQEARAVFQDHGYRVAEEPVIYVVPGAQGERYVVPHRSVSLISSRQ